MTPPSGTTHDPLDQLGNSAGSTNRGHVGEPEQARRVINGFTGEELGKVWICDRCGYEENMVSDYADAGGGI